MRCVCVFFTLSRSLSTILDLRFDICFGGKCNSSQQYKHTHSYCLGYFFFPNQFVLDANIVAINAIYLFFGFLVSYFDDDDPIQSLSTCHSMKAFGNKYKWSICTALSQCSYLSRVFHLSRCLFSISLYFQNILIDRQVIIWKMDFLFSNFYASNAIRVGILYSVHFSKKKMELLI